MVKSTYKLDETDKKILALLQRDTTLPVAEIAEKVGLSQSSCWRRINRAFGRAGL